MSRPSFLLFESALVLVGLALLGLLFGLPSCGDGEAPTVAAPTGEPMVNMEIVGDGGDASGEGEGDGDSAAEGNSCTPPVDADFLSANQVVSFYGNPYSADLGILGALPRHEMVSRLHEQVKAIDEVNGMKGVQPALHLVSSTAQPDPGRDGNYVLRVDMETLDDWAKFACEEGLLLFLDIQRGHAPLDEEIDRIRPLLEMPSVHLALDPEFAMAPGELPGQAVGGYTADEINVVQEELQGIVDEKGFPAKLLVVHQFEINMIMQPWDIEAYPGVAVIVDMDGFGAPATKVRQFKSYSQPAEYSGIKLFYTVDKPLMTEEEVARLRPNLVIYQ
jgi:hypothetical protein